MREKLLDLMKHEGLKPSQLAEMLEINPAGISHILAGRNKPGFDLLQKILRRFPQINPDWLLLDSDKMYRTEFPEAPRSTIDGAATSGPMAIPGNLFGERTKTPHPSVHTDTDSQKNSHPTVTPAVTSSASIPKTGKQVERVLIFYADQTFESYSPAK